MKPASSTKPTSSTKSPLIGISMSIDAEGNYHRVSVHYAAAVRLAGGIAVYIPLSSDEESLRKTIDRLDGLIMTGGGDIPPEAYSQTPHATVVTMPPLRFQSDKLLLPLWLKTKKPLLGICLGLQETNVMLGGTLIQDIPSCVGQELSHRKDNGPVQHQIRIDKESLLGQLSDATTADVYSWHHQAAGKIGRNLRPIARTDDKVIEAMQLTDRPFGLLVQFHPERQDESPLSRAIFRALIQAASSAEGGQMKRESEN
jgi:putative glutamine amidotransferase